MRADPTPGCLRVMTGLAILGWVATLVILWEIFHG